MNTQLYFLRSSEQKIVLDMLPYVLELESSTKTLQEYPELSIYYEYYGLTPKDLGLYALHNNQISGAIWSRKFTPEHKANGFVDADTPIIQMAVLPQFRSQGIGSAMMEQFLLEAATQYEQLSLSILQDSQYIGFFEKFGFERLEDHEHQRAIEKKSAVTMIKKLQKKELVRPSDGYDPKRWMD